MSSSDRPWLLYGAGGYTGGLIAREATARGLRPILAGRTSEPIERLANELNCPSSIFSLDRPSDIASHLADLAAVLNCAGPFSATAEPMMDACIQAGCHYLDITGEIGVIEAAAARSEAARQAGMAIIPAVGFDVVPSDCLAATLLQRLPGATHLQLAIGSMNSISRGTAKTMLESLPDGGKARINGRIERVPIGWRMMEVPFREGRRWAMTIPWGDVASAYYSTGIPNTEVYAAAPLRYLRWVKRLRFAAPALRIRVLRSALNWIIEKRVAGPTEEERRHGRASLWGKVSHETGAAVEGTLITPDGYQLTVLTALASVERLLAGSDRRGFLTPSTAFGSEFITTIPGCDLQVE